MKYIIADSHNTVGYGDVSDGNTAIKCTIPNDRHRQAVEGVGDGDIAAGAGVAGDGAGAATVVGVFVIAGSEGVTWQG